MVQSFPLVGNWLVWKVGKGDKVRIRIDPCVTSGEDLKLPDDVNDALHREGIFTLALADSPDTPSIWQQDWKKG